MSTSSCCKPVQCSQQLLQALVATCCKHTVFAGTHVLLLILAGSVRSSQNSTSHIQFFASSTILTSGVSDSDRVRNCLVEIYFSHPKNFATRVAGPNYCIGRCIFANNTCNTVGRVPGVEVKDLWYRNDPSKLLTVRLSLFPKSPKKKLVR